MTFAPWPPQRPSGRNLVPRGNPESTANHDRQEHPADRTFGTPGSRVLQIPCNPEAPRAPYDTNDRRNCVIRNNGKIPKAAQAGMNPSLGFTAYNFLPSLRPSTMETKTKSARFLNLLVSTIDSPSISSIAAIRPLILRVVK